MSGLHYIIMRIHINTCTLQFVGYDVGDRCDDAGTR